MSEGDVAFAHMRVFASALASAGVGHACVSPGSRSSPLAIALWREPRIRVHVHLDERASSFFALGLAKATGLPVVVACTSGTAAAEFWPAVVEAAMSRAALVLLTADRPAELRGVGANQAIDQVELYGRYVRWFVDAPVPEAADDPERWRSLALEAATRSFAHHPPGPVHVNLPFREPLVPSGAPSPPAPTRFGFLPMPASAPVPAPRTEELHALLDLIDGVERGVVYAGSLRVGAGAMLDLAAALGWPVIAEPTSGLRVPGTLAAGQLLLGDEPFRSEHRPELVLQVGAAPTSRTAQALTAGAEHLVIVDPDDLVADPGRRAELRLVADPNLTARELLDRAGPRAETGWLAGWREADERAGAAVDRLLDGWDEPFEGRVARDLAAALPDGGILCVGASMPVRDLDAFMRPREGIRVVANRGASGIDGSVSIVLGTCVAGAPTFALLGDLTLLHDVGSLLWSARRGQDAVFVVPNNGGGVIFSFLAQRELPAAELEGLFTTPHHLDLGLIARAAAAGHALVEHAEDLTAAVLRAHKAGGVWVVEVPSDRERNVTRHAEIGATVAAAVRSA